MGLLPKSKIYYLLGRSLGAELEDQFRAMGAGVEGRKREGSPHVWHSLCPSIHAAYVEILSD